MTVGTPVPPAVPDLDILGVLRGFAIWAIDKPHPLL